MKAEKAKGKKPTMWELGGSPKDLATLDRTVKDSDGSGPMLQEIIPDQTVSAPVDSNIQTHLDIYLHFTCLFQDAWENEGDDQTLGGGRGREEEGERRFELVQRSCRW